MARRVSQVSPATVVKNVVEGTEDKFYAAGFKIDKHAGDEGQQIYVDYFTPQPIYITLREAKANWNGDVNLYSKDRLIINTLDDEQLSPWDMNNKGIKFFRSKKNADKYFLMATHRLYSKMQPITDLYNTLHREIEEDDPTFLIGIS